MFVHRWMLEYGFKDIAQQDNKTRQDNKWPIEV